MQKYFLILLFILPLQSWGKRFDTGFMRLDLPANWVCEKKDLQWTCTDNGSSTTTAAIIVITGKQAGASENMDSFKKILAQPKNLPNKAGLPTPSEVLAIGDQLINGQSWVNAVHKNSELENYTTNYLVTRKEQLAVLIMLSAHKNYYDKYEGLFGQVIDSFEITAPQALLQPEAQVPTVSPQIATTEEVPAPTDGAYNLEGDLMWKLKNDIKYQAGALLALLIAGFGIYSLKS